MTHQSSFSELVAPILDEYCPARFPFFGQLKAASTSVVKSPVLLEELYKRYQAAMHCTRVMIYYVPFMDEVELRARKCAIIADDDLHSMGDSHHSQLRRTWTYMLGHPPATPDSYFSDLPTLAAHIEHGTARFVRYIDEAYRRSVGPCCVVEGLAHGWISELADALSPHFPGIHDTPYFIENLKSNVELRHAAEMINLVSMVIARRPAIRPETIEEVRSAAEELRLFWKSCCNLL